MNIVICFYTEIVSGDAERVLSQLRANPDASVEVRINSPGGSVAEGLAIYNALKPRKPIVYIDGIAASIASLIAMAGSKVIAAENALVMIHDPWAGAQGNSTELRKTADLLDKHRDAMLGAYSRTGLNRDDILGLLAAETWMSADEALKLGFVDEIAEPLRYAAHAPDCFAGYYNTPKELLMNTRSNVRNAENPNPSDPANPNPSTPNPDLTKMDDAQLLAALKKGLSSDAVTQAASDSVLQALKERNTQIAAMATGYMGNTLVRNCVVDALADPKMSVQAFGQKLMAALAHGSEPLNVTSYGSLDTGVPGASNIRAYGGSSVSSSYGNGSDFVLAASDALALRAGITIAKPHPGVRDLNGMSLNDIVRACVTREGRGFDSGTKSHGAMVRAALSTSDFPAILENTLGKALRAGFAVEPATYEAWTRKVLVPDFKPQSRVLLGSSPELLPVAEYGEYTHGSLDEDKSVPYSVGKFGRLVQFSWEALINDDLGAFLRMTQALGQAAARAEGDAVYSTFAENSGAGPAMQDAVHLFHATHNNLAATQTALNAAALGAARVLLRRQTALGGGVLNLTPRYLLVSPEHEQAAEALLAASARSVSQGAENAMTPAWLAKLELVVEARLTDDAFYVTTGPESVDTLERAWLEADNGPVIEEEDAFGSDAKTYKVRHVFAARWLDWRGAVKVPVSP